MRLLLCLACRGGAIVSIDELLDTVWAGVTVSPDSVYQAITLLRRQLGDDPKQPTYIATVPRLGYRMVAAVCPWEEKSAEEPAITEQPAAHSVPAAVTAPERRVRLRAGLAWAGGVTLCAVLATAFLVHDRAASDNRPSSSQPSQPLVAPRSSIAVLPFLDLTSGMKEEEFADGMTEELIDRLSKIPGLKVPTPTAVFYFKGKQLSVDAMAKSLGVAYVLDGSVRKSGGQIRVAARLVRADNSYVIWSETYDRPFGDILTVQDDIAGQVTKALKASIGVPPR